MAAYKDRLIQAADLLGMTPDDLLSALDRREEQRETSAPGTPVPTANAAHQPIVPMAGGIPPRCTCGFVGGNGITRPLLATHLREVDPTYGQHDARPGAWQR